MKEKVTAVVLAAGKGSRMHSNIQKQYMTLFRTTGYYLCVRSFLKTVLLMKLFLWSLQVR